MKFRKQQVKPDMEQQTGFKLGKEYIKGVQMFSCLFPTAISLGTSLTLFMVDESEAQESHLA